MIRRFTLYLVPASFILLAYTLPVFAQSGVQKHRLVTQNIDENNLITLRGNTHPAARASNDVGRVADDFPLEHMYLQLKRPAEEHQLLRTDQSPSDQYSSLTTG